MIKIHDVNKYFFRHKRNEIHVLNNLNLEFPESGLVVLLGPSGSGKTTLLNVIGGLDSIQKGYIEFDQEKIEGYQSKVWDRIRNEKVGYIFQNYNLLPQLSVYENVALVLRMMGITDEKAIDDRVSYILNAVNMYPFRKKKSTQLSGGQQQRVAIARALVKNPEVIIADEPTGNLDSKNTTDIMNIIKVISRQKLVILVTHEKDLAKVYGDRIIELKDGQIVDDYINDPSHMHIGKDSDDIIYLKDLKQSIDLNDGTHALKMYQDVEGDLGQVKVRLIVKNKTLYLDVDAPLQKVKLLDQSSNLIIKDEHFVQKNKEELLETSFDTHVLDNKEVSRSYKAIVSIKSVVQFALQKILYASKKGKIMLFSFIVSGAVMAFMISMVAATLIPDLSIRPYGDGYVFASGGSSQLSYQTIQNYARDESSSLDPDLYVNTMGQRGLSIMDPMDETRILIQTTDTYVDLVDHAPSGLKAGRRPVEPHEILISYKLADTIIQNQGPDYGIWTYEHLLMETIKIDEQDVKLVGISSAEIRQIYVSRALGAALSNGTMVHNNNQITYLGKLRLKADDITHGDMPAVGEVVISTGLYQIYVNADLNTLSEASFPLEISALGFEVSGVVLNNGLMVYADAPIVERARMSNMNQFYVFTNNAELMVSRMVNDDLPSYVVRTETAKRFNEMMATQRITTLIVGGVILGLNLLGFYFIMRSSMISRIYEISVYRALGMKKSEILASFMFEVIILTSLTTLIGLIFSNISLISLDDTLIGQFRIFLVDPLTFVVGILIIYLVNLLGGILPITSLLRKTPSQILTQYDI